MSRVLGVISCVSAGLVLCSPVATFVAQAQDKKPAVDDARARARTVYARGQERFSAGDYEGAEAAFLEAYELVPNPVVLKGVAKAREAAGDLVGAADALAQYLEASADARDASEVVAQVEGLRDRLVTFSIDSEPQGATVTLDGEDTGDTTPAMVLGNPGTRTVSVAMEGFSAEERSVEAEEGSRREIKFELEPLGVPEGLTGEEGVFGAGEGVGEPPPEEADEAATGEGGGAGAGVWVATGVAASALVTGTVLGFLALDKESSYRDAPTKAKADSGERLALFADVCFGLSAAAAITGLVLFFTEKGDGAEDATEPAAKLLRLDVAPAVTRNGAGVAARVRF